MIEIEAPDESQKAYHHIERLSNLYVDQKNGFQMNNEIRRVTSDENIRQSLRTKSLALAKRKLSDRKRKNRLLGSGMICFSIGLCFLSYYLDGRYIIAPIGLFGWGALLIINSARAIEVEI